MKINPEDKSALKSEGFMTRDPREVERKKPGRQKLVKDFNLVSVNILQIKFDHLFCLFCSLQIGLDSCLVSKLLRLFILRYSTVVFFKKNVNK